jgi:hypothetical protein
VRNNVLEVENNYIIREKNPVSGEPWVAEKPAGVLRPGTYFRAD